MRKCFSYLAAGILALPLVFAAQKGIVEKVLEGAFDAAGSDIFVKIALWMVMFAGLYFGATRAFPDNTRVPGVIAIVISFIAIRFMPLAWLGAFKTYLFVAAILLVPYFVVSMVFHNPKWKWFFYIVSLLILWYLFSNLSPVYGIAGSELVDYFRFAFLSHWIAGIPGHYFIFGLALLLLLIIAFVKWRLRRRGETAGEVVGGGDGGGYSGPGVLGGIGNWLTNRSAASKEAKLARLQQKQMGEEAKHRERMLKQQMKEDRYQKAEEARGRKEQERERRRREKEQAGAEKTKRRSLISRIGDWRQRRKENKKPWWFRKKPKAAVPIEKSKSILRGPDRMREAIERGEISKIRPSRWRRVRNVFRRRGAAPKVRPGAPTVQKPPKKSWGERLGLVSSATLKGAKVPPPPKPRFRGPPPPKGYRPPRAGPPRGYKPYVRGPAAPRRGGPSKEEIRKKLKKSRW